MTQSSQTQQPKETVIRKKAPSRISNILWNNIVWLLLIGAVVIMGLFEPMFFNPRTILSIFTQGAILGILAIAVSFTLLIGDIDLSVVGIAALSACWGVLLMQRVPLPWWLTILFIVGVGIGMGFLNGILIAKLKAVPLILTLAFQLTYRGAVMAITEGQSIFNFTDIYKFLGQGYIGGDGTAGTGFPVIIIVFLLVFLVVHFIWTRTPFGRSLYAVGGNAASARVSGIKVDRVRILAFTISGGLSGFAGYLLSAYMGSVTVNFGDSYVMNSIAAAVIGGVSLSGGKGKVIGVLGGTLLLQAMNIGLQVLGISSYSVSMIGGFMILAAVIIDAFRNKREEAQ